MQARYENSTIFDQYLAILYYTLHLLRFTNKDLVLLVLYYYYYYYYVDKDYYIAERYKLGTYRVTLKH